MNDVEALRPAMLGVHATARKDDIVALENNRQIKRSIACLLGPGAGGGQRGHGFSSDLHRVTKGLPRDAFDMCLKLVSFANCKSIAPFEMMPPVSKGRLEATGAVKECALTTSCCEPFKPIILIQDAAEDAKPG